MPEPWIGDACSLVEAFRAGDLSPLDALEASLDAIDSSQLNAFSFVDPERARRWAAEADVSLPLGGVPIGVKELDYVEGWPATEACLALKDRLAPYHSTTVERLLAAGAVPVGLTTASELGFVNYTSTRLNGTTRNPWGLTRTPGGSSGGSAAAVAGGLVPLATAGDGGGSIRIPAGYSGMFGLKSTFGRIPRGPRTEIGSLTVTLGCISRSVRDTARWFDVCNGYDARDPLSLPRVEGWEAGLGTRVRPGLRVAISPDLDGATVLQGEVRELVQKAAEALVADAGMEVVDVPVKLPQNPMVWGLANLPMLLAWFGDRWPDCIGELGEELAMGSGFLDHYKAQHFVAVEHFRVDCNEAMADVFEQVDLLICATNPYEAFAAEGPVPTEVEGRLVNPFETGALTIPGNVTGHPAVSVPVGRTSSGLPVGMQVYGRRHEEPLLLDLALLVEQSRPWPLVAPGAPV
jgi:Asp-tRNA(Asn)/Glu-tRNA(Gln) amidotransferase A subunit family amidase